MSWSMLIAKPRRLRATHEKSRNKMQLLKLLVGATMSKFAKCQTQANCQECPTDLSLSGDKSSETFEPW